MTHAQNPPQAALTQDDLKTLVGQAALRYVVPGEIVGVGTGSTVNKFIDALAGMKDQIKGAVSSSLASTARLQALGRFPLPVEVIPMAAQRIMRQFAALGALATLRLNNAGLPLVTDNGQHILDVTGLQITDPLAFETRVSQWPGVVTVGVFAWQKAHICLLGTSSGVKTLTFQS